MSDGADTRPDATEADLKDMPPITISVNECDPLRDEGVEFGKKLVSAGVETMTRNVMGTCHAGDLLSGRGPIMDATMRDMKAFAEGCPVRTSEICD